MYGASDHTEILDEDESSKSAIIEILEQRRRVSSSSIKINRSSATLTTTQSVVE